MCDALLPSTFYEHSKSEKVISSHTKRSQTVQKVKSKLKESLLTIVNLIHVAKLFQKLYLKRISSLTSMHLLAFMLCADNPLSRVDMHSMPLYMRLECLVESMDMKRHLKDKDGEYLEINEWKWTKFDPNGDVLVIDWSDKWPDANSGTIELRWLPDTIKSFHITGTKYEGTLDVGGLPASLENLYLQRNNMDGTVDFAAVSMRMRNFVLHTNRFHGALDLRSIPPNMEYLCLQKKQFYRGCHCWCASVCIVPAASRNE